MVIKWQTSYSDVMGWVDGTGQDVLCHSQSHELMHSKIKNEMEKRAWHG